MPSFFYYYYSFLLSFCLSYLRQVAYYLYVVYLLIALLFGCLLLLAWTSEKGEAKGIGVFFDLIYSFGSLPSTSLVIAALSLYMGGLVLFSSLS